MWSLSIKFLSTYIKINYFFAHAPTIYVYSSFVFLDGWVTERSLAMAEGDSFDSDFDPPSSIHRRTASSRMLSLSPGLCQSNAESTGSSVRQSSHSGPGTSSSSRSSIAVIARRLNYVVRHRLSEGLGTLWFDMVVDQLHNPLYYDADELKFVLTNLSCSRSLTSHDCSSCYR